MINYNIIILITFMNTNINNDNNINSRKIILNEKIKGKEHKSN